MSGTSCFTAHDGSELSTPDPGHVRRRASGIPSRRARLALVGGALAQIVVLTGCAATVDLPTPTADPAVVDSCRQLIAALPEQLAGQTRRDTADPGRSAAWGVPPIGLRCGVETPAALTPSSQCYEVDGVGWFAEEVDAGYLFTTIGRRYFVEVQVPNRYAPEAGPLTDLAAAVDAHDPVVTPCV